MLLKHQHITQK